MSDTNKKTLTEITYYFADPRVTAPSPFIGELFVVDEEQGDVYTHAKDGDFIVLTTKVQTLVNGTKKTLPGAKISVPMGFLWRSVTEVTRDRKDTDPVRVTA